MAIIMDANITTEYTYSRFNQTQRVLYDGQETLGMWVNPITDQLVNTAGKYVVANRYEGRPDLIAYEAYGSSSLDWLLIAVNKATGALNWPRAGDVILIPQQSLIASELI
jgi:hypothetical protein